MTNIEYAIMLGVVFLAFLVAFVALSDDVSEMWNNVSSHAGTRSPEAADG